MESNDDSAVWANLGYGSMTLHERICTYKQHGDVLVCNGTVPFSCVQIWFSFTGLPVRRHNSAELLVRVLLKRSIVLTLQVHSMNESVSDT